MMMHMKRIDDIRSTFISENFFSSYASTYRKVFNALPTEKLLILKFIVTHQLNLIFYFREKWQQKRMC